MKLKGMLAALAATSLSISPVMAQPSAPANPAASLSVAKSVRASSTPGKDRLAGGGGILAVLIAAGVAAILVIAVVKDDNSDSN